MYSGTAPTRDNKLSAATAVWVHIRLFDHLLKMVIRATICLALHRASCSARYPLTNLPIASEVLPMREMSFILRQPYPKVRLHVVSKVSCPIRSSPPRAAAGVLSMRWHSRPCGLIDPLTRSHQERLIRMH